MQIGYPISIFQWINDDDDDDADADNGGDDDDDAKNSTQLRMSAMLSISYLSISLNQSIYISAYLLI